MNKKIISTKLNVTPICPSCSAILNGTTGQGTPKPEDITICIYCATPLNFDGDLSLRRITRKEFETFPAEIVAQLKKMQKKVLQLIENEKEDGN